MMMKNNISFFVFTKHICTFKLNYFQLKPFTIMKKLLNINSLIIILLLSLGSVSFISKHETNKEDVNAEEITNCADGEFFAAYQGIIASVDAATGCVVMNKCGGGTVRFGQLATLLPKDAGAFQVGQSVGVILEYDRNMCYRLRVRSSSSITCY